MQVVLFITSLKFSKIITVYKKSISEVDRSVQTNRKYCKILTFCLLLHSINLNFHSTYTVE